MISRHATSSKHPLASYRHEVRLIGIYFVVIHLLSVIPPFASPSLALSFPIVLLCLVAVPTCLAYL